MNVTFRTPDTSELPQVLLLMKQYYECDHLVFDPKVAERATKELMADEKAGGIWFIGVDGREVGYVVLSIIHSLEFHGMTAFVDEVFILEEYRRKGIGARTLEFVGTYCRDRGIDAMRLEVERSNLRAQRFYEKVGFERHDRYLMTRWIDKK